MGVSKHYKPKSVYIDKVGTRYTIIHKPELKLYRMYRINSYNDIISNSGCDFQRWISELKYVGNLPEVNYDPKQTISTD